MSVNNSKAYSGQQGCVTIPARKCKENVAIPEWALGKPLVSKFLFNKADIEHLRRGSIWAEQMDPEQKYTAFRIIECEPEDTGKCKITSEFSHIQFIDAGFDLEKYFGVGPEEEPPGVEPNAEKLIAFIRSFLEFIIWLKDAHLVGFSHNDIKLNNFCFDGSKVRLIDFSDRSHTVWDAVLKSQGLGGGGGGRMITFDNNRTKMTRQLIDIDTIREILIQLFDTLPKSYRLSLHYLRALKISKRLFEMEEAPNAQSPLMRYTQENNKLQQFLKLLLNQIVNIPAGEMFAKEEIDYDALFNGRDLTEEEADCLKLKKRALRDQAFMRTWSEDEASDFTSALKKININKGGRRLIRKSRRRINQFKRTYRAKRNI